MSVTPNYVPSGYKTVNVMLVVKNAHKALQFYNQAFAAETTMILENPQGQVVHAEFKISDTIMMLTEEFAPEVESPSAIIQLYMGDPEACFEDAIAAGAEVIYPLKKQFYGDRAGRIKDPFGHHWIIATRMEDFTAAEIQNKFNELFS